MALLQGAFGEGDSIRVDLRDDELVFERDVPVVEGEPVV
jgi:hypothetical protein